MEEVFEAYLECGGLEHGFLRVGCEIYRHEMLVAFLDSPADRIGLMRDVIARSQAARPLRRASSNRASSSTPWSRFTGSWFMRIGETWKRRGLSMVGRLSVRL